MIKLLFLTEQLTGGGAEKALQRLVNHMDPAVFDITVQTVNAADPAGILKPHIRYKAINRRNSRLFSWWLRLCAALGWAYPLYIRGGYHMEVAYLESFPTKLLAASPNRKLAWVHCDMDQKAERSKMRPWYRSYDHIVCVSEDVRKRFLRHFTGRTAVLPNVIDGEEILEKTMEFSAEKTTFAAVGRLSYEKGFDRLLDACEKLKAEGFDFTLRIIGDGPERPALETQIEQYGLTNVELVGFQENPYPYMAAAGAIVIPSRTEGASTVAAEALILGKPILATPCAGMEELLGDCAILTEDIYAGMKQLLTDPACGAAYATAAKARGRRLSKAWAVRETEVFLLAVLGENRG